MFCIFVTFCLDVMYISNILNNFINFDLYTLVFTYLDINTTIWTGRKKNDNLESSFVQKEISSNVLLQNFYCSSKTSRRITDILEIEFDTKIALFEGAVDKSSLLP